MEDKDKTIEDLKARLIERTEQSTATAYRDAERIRALEEENREMKAMLSGKEEAV